jgi:haloalkane dehalogenase
VEVLRTPDDRFENLPGFDFEPRYVEIPSVEPEDPTSGEGASALRIHYIDEGPEGAEVVLMLHGEPSWCFLYRKMIPIFVDAGLRAVAPDLIGFGRSDKPYPREEYTYRRHVFWMRSWLEAVGLDNVTLVCQDWGGLIGLRLVAESPQVFARVVAANTFLPTGDVAPGEAFMAWRKLSQEIPELPVGRIVAGGCVSKLSPEVVAAYDAPFPDERFKEGARQFPVLVPISPDDPEAEPNRRAWESLRAYDRPFLTAFSDSDPITRGADRVLQSLIPGAAGRRHVTIEGAGHFLQEDKGEDLARTVLDFIEETR